MKKTILGCAGYNGNQPYQKKPCTGNVSFTTGNGSAMIEFAFVIAASMRIMAEEDKHNRLRCRQPYKEARTADCFA